MADLSKLSTEDLMKIRDEKAAAQKAQTSKALSEMSTEDLLRLREQKVQQERAIQPGESIARGGFQGASLGFVDELAGKLEGLGSLVGVRGLGGGFNEWRKETPEEAGQSFSEVDASRKNQRRIQDQEAKRQNPGYYAGGQFLGSVAATAVPALGVAPAAGLLKTTAKLAGLGAVEAAGTSEGKVGSEEFNTDVAKGAAISGAFGPVGYLAQKLKPSELKKFANLKAVKAAGAMKAQFKTMDSDEVQNIGRFVLENKLVTTFSNLDDTLKKVATLKDDVGAGIGKAISSVDDLINDAKSLVDADAFGKLNPASKNALKRQIDDGFAFNKKKIAERIRKELIDPNSGNPILSAQMTSLERIAKGFDSQKAASLAEGLVIKGSQRKVTNFDSDSVPNAFKKELYDIVKSELDESVGKIGFLESAVAKASGKAIGKIDAFARGKSLKEQYQALNKKYFQLSKIEDISADRLAQQRANRAISLSDYIVGGAGLTGGAALTYASPMAGASAIVLAGLNKIVRTYGDNAAAVGANNIAEMMLKSPQAMQKWSALLTDAATQGSVALTATHLMLMKNDPEYKSLAEGSLPGLRPPSQGLTIPGR